MASGNTPEKNEVFWYINFSESKVSIMEEQDSSTDELFVDRQVDGNPLSIVILFSQKKLVKSCAIFLAQLIFVGLVVCFCATPC